MKTKLDHDNELLAAIDGRNLAESIKNPVNNKTMINRGSPYEKYELLEIFEDAFYQELRKN